MPASNTRDVMRAGAAQENCSTIYIRFEKSLGFIGAHDRGETLSQNKIPRMNQPYDRTAHYARP